MFGVNVAWRERFPVYKVSGAKVAWRQSCLL